MPDNLKLHAVYLAADGNTGTCIWEAETVQEVQRFLDENAGKYATNFCYEVNVKDSFGLPKIPMLQEHLN